jgi:hypothetical protein
MSIHSFAQAQRTHRLHHSPTDDLIQNVIICSMRRHERPTESVYSKEFGTLTMSGTYIIILKVLAILHTSQGLVVSSPKFRKSLKLSTEALHRCRHVRPRHHHRRNFLHRKDGRFCSGQRHHYSTICRLGVRHYPERRKPQNLLCLLFCGPLYKDNILAR